MGFFNAFLLKRTAQTVHKNQQQHHHPIQSRGVLQQSWEHNLGTRKERNGIAKYSILYDLRLP